MIESKTKVFLTGPTGVMGLSALKEFASKTDKYHLTVLARPSARNRKKLSPFIEKGINVIWGDLLDNKALEKGISNADIILHVGGMVSPAADKDPEMTLKVNLGSIKLITDIIKKEEEKNKTIKLVYIGSVSQYGSHLPPDHWGKAGDSLFPAIHDAYAVSKILAERIMLESGIKKWVSLRQTSILHHGLLFKASDPISFHVPLNGVLEWISVEDSGTLLEKVCHTELPESFWCNFYNVGGGKGYRLTNYQFVSHILRSLGCPPPEKIFEPSWFATDNFHGIWFEDSDLLDSILHYRRGDTAEDCFLRMKNNLPLYFRLAPLAPSLVIKKYMKKVAETPEYGTLWALQTKNKEKIDSFWGSKEKHDKIGNWDNFNLLSPERETKSNNCVSDEKKIQFSSELRKEICKNGHSYFTSEILKKGGHICPHCVIQTLPDSLKDIPNSFQTL